MRKIIGFIFLGLLASSLFGEIQRLHMPLNVKDMIVLEYYSVGYGYWGANISPSGQKIALNAGTVQNEDEAGKLAIVYVNIEKNVTTDIKLSKSDKYQWLDEESIVFTSGNSLSVFNTKTNTITSYNKQVVWKELTLKKINDKRSQYVLPQQKIAVYKINRSPADKSIEVAWSKNNVLVLNKVENLLDYTNKYFLFEEGAQLYLFRYN